MDESATSNRTRIWAFVGLGAAVLVAVVLLVFGGIGGGGQGSQVTTEQTYQPGTGQTDAPVEEPPGTPTAEATAESDAGEPMDGHDHGDPYEPDEETIRAVQDTSIAFIEAWLLNADQDARAEALDPHVIPRLRDSVALSDQANLPEGQPDGEPEVTIEQPTTATSLVTLSSGEVIQCDLLAHPDGWRVATFGPAEDPTAEPTQNPAEAPTDGDGGG